MAVADGGEAVSPTISADRTGEWRRFLQEGGEHNQDREMTLR
jgi:hypothetical protein